MPDFTIFLQKDGHIPGSLLDIGCGLCEEGRDILAKGIRLTGIDQDGETIRKVQKRLPRGKFIIGDAAYLPDRMQEKYDAVLIRRPDVIFSCQNWERVFQTLPAVLNQDGIVIVSTPGQSEARICADWLRKTFRSVHTAEIRQKEEEYMIRAEDMKQTSVHTDPKKLLIQSLSWDENEPHMVCDLRTGKCTVVSDEKESEE